MPYQTPYYKRIQSSRAGSARPSASMRAQPNDSSNFLNDFDYNSVLSGIGQGLEGYASGEANTYNFSVDPNAGYSGSVKGLAGGGAIGAIAGGIGGQMGTFAQANKNIKGLGVGVNLTGGAGDGSQPVYMGGAYAEAENKVGALNAGEKSTEMFWNGGKSFDPATMGFNALYGTSRKIKRKRGQLNEQVTAAQQQYNSSAARYEDSQRSLNDYYNRLNNNSQMYNLYNG